MFPFTEVNCMLRLLRSTSGNNSMSFAYRQ